MQSDEEAVMLARVRFDRRLVSALTVGLAAGGIGLGLARTGFARTRAESRTRAGACGSADGAGVSTPCVQVGGRMRQRRVGFTVSRPGSAVSASAVFGDRVFLNAREGVALANGDNAQYPVLTADGGRVWRIDGPALHVDAADGAEGVGSIGITGPRTFFAYGSSVVDVTTNRGRTWWETYLGEDVVAVVPCGRRELCAYVEQSLSNEHLDPAVTWEYVTRDGGRRWRYSTDFAGIPR